MRVAERRAGRGQDAPRARDHDPGRSRWRGRVSRAAVTNTKRPRLTCRLSKRFVAGYAKKRTTTKLREILGDAATQIAKLAPEIETRLGPFPERHEFAPHEERLLFFDAVAPSVFQPRAAAKSLLFYADDLHWADRGTLWLLGHLLRQLRERTRADRRRLSRNRTRSRTSARQITRRLEPRTSDHAHRAATLQRIGNAAISSARCWANTSAASLQYAVHRETEGNPFFVEEVLKALIEQGSVRRESGRWRRCDMDELLIPQSVKEAIGNRLDRVSQNCNEVLRVGAMLGKVFTFEELIAAAEQNEDTLLDALDEAVGAQLIAAGSGDSFSFTHDKIREVLYEELNPIRRRPTVGSLHPRRCRHQSSPDRHPRARRQI